MPVATPLRVIEDVALEDRRHEFRDKLLIDDAPIGTEKDRVTWWTFAGGQINTTFRYVIESLGDWDVTTSNFRVEVEGEGIHDQFDDIRSRLRDDAFWQDDTVWNVIRRSLPDYRLSKFQDLLPEWAEREMLAEFLLDLEGARRFLE